MKLSMACLPAAAVLVAALGADRATAACSHVTQIRNDSPITLRIAELKSSYSPPVFKSQWTGSRVVAPGATGTISWTSDLNCTDASGVAKHWEVEFFRNNGQVHCCSRLGPAQGVRINTPDLCLPD